MGFCEYLREATVDCPTCQDNKVNSCQIKVGLQPYYSDFALYDTITISRKTRPIVETDIEVTYKTSYPYGMYAGKGAEFYAAQKKTERAIGDYLRDRLPPGTVVRPYHLHYSPDKHDPNIVALHIHAMKRTEDLDMAVLIAKQLVDVIHPREIEEALFKGGENARKE